MPDPKEFQYDVFLSHNRAQKDWTRELARRLQEDKFRVFFDEWEMPKHLGKNWIDVLERSVKESRRVALVLSPDFFSHDWTRFEGNIIQLLDPVGDKGRILPLLHTPCELPERWRFLQGLPLNAAAPGSLEFEFRYQQLLHNLDNTRPYESDFEKFKIQHADGKKSDVVPPVTPLPKGSRMIHAPSPLFVGRDSELRDLARLLAPGSHVTVGVHAVTGMGGVGKTQLAIEYVHRYGARYPGGVFWLNMERAEEAINEVARCGGLDGMNLPGFGNIGVPDQAAIVRKIWEDGSSRLLVFDNAEEPGLVEEWRPRTGRCSVLITSRRQEWPAELGIRPMTLETLPREKSLEMLREARPAIDNDKTEREAAGKVCDLLGDLPLALNVAANYLRKYKSDRISQYLDALLKQPAIQSKSLEKVGASFAVSYGKLNQNDPTDALAMLIFHLGSYFAPVSINQEILAGAAGLNLDETEERHRFDDAVARLLELGLVREEEDGRLLLHRLLREYAALRIPEGWTAEKALEAVADQLLDFAQRENQTGLPQKLTPERPHLREVAEATERLSLAPAAGLYNSLGFHGKSIALFQEAREDHERALKIDEAVHGPEHPNVAIRVNNLGGVLQVQGDLARAKACYERALKIGEVALGLEHPTVAIFVNNLGEVLRTQGDLAGAKACYERALKIGEVAYGPEDLNVAISVNNLGAVLKDQGDLAGAKACFERALKIDEAAFGPEHPDVAIDLNNLGTVLKAQGDLAGAKACYERALEIDEAVYGREHPDVAIDVNNLGLVLQDQGDLAGAKACYERALKIGEAAYGPEHPKVAIRVSNLGTVLKAQGDVAGAKACFERALAIFKKFLGDDHPSTRLVKGNLDGLG